MSRKGREGGRKGGEEKGRKGERLSREIAPRRGQGGQAARRRGIGVRHNERFEKGGEQMDNC